jgi:hypothetical protein
MEIHAPDHPITSWKETAKHLAIITAGVLIALALEGVVAWADHRLLVREAKANLISEIRGNKKELEGLFANINREAKELEEADRLAQTVTARGRIDEREIHLNLSWNFAELKNAAVTTGQITGAFGFMDYAEVRHFADVYDLQAQFMRSQERQVQEFQPIYAFISRITDAKPPSQASVEEWRGRIGNAIAGLGFQETLARALLKRYDELLAGK